MHHRVHHALPHRHTDAMQIFFFRRRIELQFRGFPQDRLFGKVHAFERGIQYPILRFFP